MNKKVIAQKLKEKRQEKGLSVREVAMALNSRGIDVSEKTIYGWESGHRQPDSDIFLTLCNIYGINSFNEFEEDSDFVPASFGPILQNLREEKSISAQKIAKFLDRPTSDIEAIEKGIIPLQSYTASLYAASLGTTLEALQMKSSSDIYSASPLVLKYNALDPHGKKLVDTVVNLEFERHQEYRTNEVQPMTKETIRVYISKAAAGYPLPILEDGFDLINKDGTVPIGADFGLVLAGDSMEPYYPDGSIVWVKSQSTLDSGEIGIFVIAGEATCKKFILENKKCYLISLNPKYAPIEVTQEMEMKTAGKVIGRN